jgi:uncharacterized protein (DUF1697 family)
MRYLALLRGINVGGNNIIKMVALREAFESAGFSEVATYIQSGNVVFDAPSIPKAKLTLSVEKMLDKAFSYESRVVLVSARELALVMDEAPPKFGAAPTRYRYDVVFVKEPLTTREALAHVTTNPEVDVAIAGKHALYFRRLIAKASKSHLAKIAARPVYRSLTIRNWNTTKQLAAMAAARDR